MILTLEPVTGALMTLGARKGEGRFGEKSESVRDLAQDMPMLMHGTLCEEVVGVVVASRCLIICIISPFNPAETPVCASAPHLNE